MRLGVLLLLCICSCRAWAQSFEWLDRQETIQSGVGENLRIPIRIKNTTDKAQYYVIRLAASDFGTTQKGYFCLDKNCFEPAINEFSKRAEPGETINNIYFIVETGLVVGQHTMRFEIFQRGFPGDFMDHNVSLSVEEKIAKSLVFKSKDITVHDVYPNPATDLAFMDYQLHNEMAKAKVVVHNILGSAVGNYELSFHDFRLKIQTEELPAGIYFYTLYLDNDGVLTRKLVIRK